MNNMNSAYEIYVCKVHNKTIYHFKSELITGRFHCWECLKETRELHKIFPLETGNSF